MPVPVRPARPTISHFYKYSNAEHLDRLESIILRHELYFPTPRQLNDPVDGKPKLAQCSLEQIMNWLLESFINNNPGLPSQEYERAAQEIAYNTPRFGTDVLVTRDGKNAKFGIREYPHLFLPIRYTKSPKAEFLGACVWSRLPFESLTRRCYALSKTLATWGRRVP
jgi:hypothetical protein